MKSKIRSLEITGLHIHEITQPMVKVFDFHE